jgi:Myo-inositol oxygenase
MGPQTNLSQIEHLLQTAEAIRRDGKPEWMQVTGLVHDLGKLLFLFDSEGQWDVVGVCAQSALLIPELGILTPSLSHNLGYFRRRLQILRQDHISRDVRSKPRLAR